jgi:hypothetical protein
MEFKPEFDVKTQGHAIAKYLGPKDDASLAQLLAFFRKEKWRGQLVLNYPGNGGMNDIVFTEVRRATVIENGTAEGS